jgi:thymidine phosphorylase
MSAFLMAVCLKGMTAAETAALTETMLRSGSVLDFSDLPGPKVDKHSTGGVGDKTSLIVAPLAASAGLFVPMITGRGLGHSGGTLDKLESIPGFDVRLDEKRFHDVVAKTGCAIIGQTESIAPADRKLYALRDVTATIESYPLITASILSKKLAEGIDGLVLDVKVGTGAFMKTQGEAEALARSLLSTSGKLGTRAVALLTDMNQPRGPSDLTGLSIRLVAHMLVLGGLSKNTPEGIARAEAELSSGRGLQKFLEIVRAQGGDPRVVDGGALPRSRSTRPIEAGRDGFVTAIDTESIGTATMLLGAGRSKVEDAIDPAAGAVVHAKIGDEVRKGEALLTLHFNEESGLEEASRRVLRAYTISDAPPPAVPDLVLAALDSEALT